MGAPGLGEACWHYLPLDVGRDDGFFGMRGAFIGALICARDG
jgi:hypothetical protein